MRTSGEATTNDRTDLQKALKLSQAINNQSWREPDLASLSDGLYDLFDCFVWGVLIADRAKPKLDLFPLTRLSSQAALASIQEKVWAAFEAVSEDSGAKGNLRITVHEVRRRYCSGGPHPARMLLPLIVDGKVTGMTFVFARRGEEYSQDTIYLFSIFANQLATTLENARLLQEVANLAVTDSLTGLYNRRRFDESLEFECLRAARYEHNLSLAIIDIDDFKLVNDTHGHQTGDQVLGQLAHVLLANTRRTDLLARWGGEEFAVILTDTNEDEACLFAERVVCGARDHIFRAGDVQLKLTVSVGVAGFHNGSALTAKQMVSRADEALYEAKRNGKNTVCRYAADLVTEAMAAGAKPGASSRTAGSH